MTQLAAKCGFRTHQPFSHIVVFEWHDGPIKGLAQSATSNSVYYFTMLDGDESLDHRVFAVYQIDNALYEDCLRALTETTEQPKYPMWCPPLVPGQVDFAAWSRTDRDRLYAVIGSSRYMDNILAIHQVTSGETIDVTEWDFDKETDSHNWAQQLFGR